MQIEYDIVKHDGDYAIRIDGVVYDTTAAFKKDFPEDQHRDTLFVSEFAFTWQEIYADIKAVWE